MSEKRRDERGEFPEELKQFGELLSSLVPAPSRINRDRLLYEAGAAASALSRPVPASAQRFWPCASAALLATSIGLGTILALRGPLPNRTADAERPVVASNTVPTLAEKTAKNVGNESAAKKLGDRPTAEDLSVDEFAAAAVSPRGNLVLAERSLHLGMHFVEVPDGAGAGPSPDTRVRSLLNQTLRNSIL